MKTGRVPDLGHVLETIPYLIASFSSRNISKDRGKYRELLHFSQEDQEANSNGCQFRKSPL